MRLHRVLQLLLTSPTPRGSGTSANRPTNGSRHQAEPSSLRRQGTRIFICSRCLASQPLATFACGGRPLSACGEEVGLGPACECRAGSVFLGSCVLQWAGAVRTSARNDGNGTGNGTSRTGTRGRGTAVACAVSLMSRCTLLFKLVILSVTVFTRNSICYNVIENRIRTLTHPRNKVSVYSDTRPLVGANNSAAAGVAVREPFGAFTTAADAGLKHTSG